MIEILEKIKGKRVIVAGDVMLDRYWWGSVSRISPEAPVPIVELERMSVVPGGAANVAVNLAGIAVEPVLFGAVGIDGEADIMRSLFVDFHLRDAFLYPLQDRKTTIKTRIVAHQQHVVRIDQETVLPIDATAVEAMSADLEREMGKADAVILSDYGKGFLSDALLKVIISLARSRRIPVLADPKGRNFDKYRGVNVITPNKREAAEATGGIDRSVETSGPEVMRRLEPDALLITEGENGMTLFEAGRSTHLDAVAQEVFDVTGAGDTVISVFAACIAAGATYLEAAKLANVAAAVVVGHVGTTHITADDLSAALVGKSLIDGAHA